MRNLKRALALVMATAMLLGMMVTGAGAAYEVFTDSDEIVNTEAVETMVSLGVINGRDDGSFDPTGTVTRAEMAKLIAVSLNGGSDPILGSGAATTTFTDTTGHWAESYIAYCANLGIINGYGDGTFGPDDTVTGTAAAKMFLTALGYDAATEGLTGTGWDLNSDTLANKIGLYDGLSTISVSAGLTRDYAAQLIYNGVQAYEVKYYTDDGTKITYADPNGTMLYNRFGVTKVEGIVVANEVYGIYGTATLEGKTRLWDDADSDGVVDSDEVAVYPVSVDKELMGQKVVIYVKYQNALAPNAANSTVVGDAIVSEDTTVVETTAELEKTSDVTSLLKTDGLSIDTTNNWYVVDQTGVNWQNDGAATPTATPATGIQSAAGQYQRFIDNTGDGIVDYVFEISPYLSKVTSISTSNDTITFTGSGLSALDNDDVISSTDLARDDIVLLTNYNGKYFVELAEMVEGTVSGYTSTSGNVTLDGVSYSPSINKGVNLTSLAGSDTSTISVGDDYILYLDEYGYMMAFDGVANIYSNFALVLDSGAEASGSLTSLSGQVKLLMADGTTGTYDVDLVDSAEKLTSTTFSSDTYREMWTAYALSNTSWNTTESSNTVAGMGTTGDGLNGEIVVYEFNSDGTVILGYADVMSSKYDSGTVDDSAVTKSTVSYSTRLDGSSSTAPIANDDTVFFFESTATSPSTNSVITSISSLPSNTIAGDGSGNVVTYDNDGTEVIVAMFVTTGNTVNSSASYVYITDDYTTMKSSDNTTYHSTPVMFDDGSFGTIDVANNYQQAEGSVYELTYNSDGYAVLTDCNGDISGSAINMSGKTTASGLLVSSYTGGVISYTNAKNDTLGIGSVSLGSATIYDIETGDVLTSSSLYKGVTIAYTLDTNNDVDVIFVTDYQDEMTTNVAQSVGNTNGFTVDLKAGQYVSAVTVNGTSIASSCISVRSDYLTADGSDVVSYDVSADAMIGKTVAITVSQASCASRTYYVTVMTAATTAVTLSTATLAKASGTGVVQIADDGNETTANLQDSSVARVLNVVDGDTFTVTGVLSSTSNTSVAFDISGYTDSTTNGYTYTSAGNVLTITITDTNKFTSPATVQVTYVVSETGYADAASTNVTNTFTISSGGWV